MEDPSRNLGQAPLIRGTGYAHKAPRRWTVLFVDDLGKIVSFRLSKLTRFALMACLAVVLALIVYLSLSFFLILRENAALQKDLHLRTAQLQRAKSDAEKALVQLMLLKAGSKEIPEESGPADGQKSKDATSKKEQPLPPADASAKVEEPGKPKPAAAVPQPTAPPKKVTAPHREAKISVGKPEIWYEPEERAFKFQFVVKNRERDGTRIKGYTFVVLTPDEGSTGVPHRAFPYTRLENGKPSHFERGQYFSITRYKFVRGTLTGITMIDRYKTATIFAYSATGELLIERAFEISKVFRS